MGINDIPHSFRQGYTPPSGSPNTPTNTPIEIQNNGQYIQWRYAGVGKWHNIVAVASLKGEPGKPGKHIETEKIANEVTERYDYSAGTIIYTAVAAPGTTDDSLGWFITKYDLNDPQNASGKIATDVSWQDRKIGSYT